MKKITAAACRRIIRKKPLTKSLYNGFVKNGWAEHLPAVYERTAALFQEYADASKALKTHLKQLLPMIALYEKAKEITGSQEKALLFMEKWAFIEAEKMMKYARAVMKLGVYRLMPALCENMLDKMFGENAGFAYRRVPDAPCFAADMTRCPYVDTCKKYGCPELCQFACKADDVTYGNLHPKLIWGRTQTLGMGGSCCDFRLYVDKNKK